MALLSLSLHTYVPSLKVKSPLLKPLIFHPSSSSSSSSSSFSSLGFSSFAYSPKSPMPMPVKMSPKQFLLKERIVLLGGEIDDSMANAIISQLLMLDNLDPNKKDIKLFINSPDGSLRYPSRVPPRENRKMLLKQAKKKAEIAREDELRSDVEEALKTWEIGKMLGLTTNSDAEAVNALAKIRRSARIAGRGMRDQTLVSDLESEQSATMAIFHFMRLPKTDVSTYAIGIAASSAEILGGGGSKEKRFALPNAWIMLYQPPGSASGQVIDVNIQTQELMRNKINVIRIISEFTGRPLGQVEKDIDREHYMSATQAIEYGVLDRIVDSGTGLVPTLPAPKSDGYDEMIKDL